MSDRKMVTLHVEYDERISEDTARQYAEHGPDHYSTSYGKAVARAGRELFPEYKYEVGQPYEVTHEYGGEVKTALFYRGKDFWSRTSAGDVWFRDRNSGYHSSLSVRRVTVGEEVK